MTDNISLSIREIDDFLQYLYLKLKGKKEGLSLAEPVAILLARLKSVNPSFYAPQLARFTSIIMDSLISRAYVSFGYKELVSLYDIAGDITLAMGDYIPAGVEKGLADIREKIDSITAVLNGDIPGAGASGDAHGKSEPCSEGFFRERVRGTIHLPLVSIYNTGKTLFSTCRTVAAQVELRITGEWSLHQNQDPVMYFEHISAEPNNAFERQIHTAVRVAEEHAAAMGMKNIQRIPREYRVSLPEIASFPASAIQRMSGGSAGLAMAVLLISVLGNLDLLRFRPRFDPGASFTGAVDEDGKILCVEDAYITEKVRAVFFSRLSKLVLPDGNLDTAKRELAALMKKYPARKLVLVPVSDINGMLNDPMVTTRHRVPAGKPILQRLFFARKHMMITASLAALLIVSLFIARPYFRRDIAQVTIKENRIVINNGFGRVITEHKLDFPLVVSENVRHKIYIEDFDGNGEKEALCVIPDSRYLNPSSKHNRLIFISFGNEGRFRHRYVYDNEILLGEQMDGTETFPIRITSHSTFFRDAQGKGRFLALAHHGSRKPGTLIDLSLEDFSKRIFFHKGLLLKMARADVDGDGILDIVLSGYNLILRSCVVVVLDPRYTQGASPRGASYEIEGFEDIAKYYLRLPDFYRYVPFSKNDSPLVAKVGNSREGLVIQVHNKGNDTRFHLRDHMECVRTEVLDSWAENEYDFKDSVSVHGYPGREKDEEELRAGIRYWDGEKWVPEPTMNRSFLGYVTRARSRKIVKIDPIDTRLVMKNSEDYQVAVYDVGFRTPNYKAYRKFFFGDFLEDEGDEIVCALCNEKYLNESHPDGGKLFILVFNDDGQLLRRHVYHEESIMGSAMENAAKNVATLMLKSSSPFVEEFGSGYLFIGTHHKTGPPVSLIRFSLADGSRETFFHKGFLQEMAARDIDGDGNGELLMTGYNLSLDAPVIVVLDPDHIDGSSPPGNCYNVPGSEIDIAKYYIRLPFYPGFDMYNTRLYPLHVEILENTGKLRIIVTSRAEEVIYSITDDMVFTGAEVVRECFRGIDQDDSIAVVTYPGIEKDEEELLRGVRFWNGVEWVPEPTVNRSYLMHVRAGDNAQARKDE